MEERGLMSIKKFNHADGLTVLNPLNNKGELLDNYRLKRIPATDIIITVGAIKEKGLEPMD
jgi:hypothetical protein